MENQTLLERKVLNVLKQLEYLCDSASFLYEDLIKKQKYLQVTFNDINFSEITVPDDLYVIEKYLQSNGLDFHMTTDPANPPILDEDHPSLEEFEFAVIDGNTIQEIKTKIKDIILNIENPIPQVAKVKISYNEKLGQITFNGVVVELEGKQKDTFDQLVHGGKDEIISWDQIYDEFKDSVTDGDIPNKDEEDRRKRSVRGAVSEINKQAEKHLKSNGVSQDLIGVKNNQYWLQHEVDKGR